MDSWCSCKTSLPAISSNWASLAFGFNPDFNPKLQLAHAVIGGRAYVTTYWESSPGAHAAIFGKFL